MPLTDEQAKILIDSLDKIEEAVRSFPLDDIAEEELVEPWTDLDNSLDVLRDEVRDLMEHEQWQRLNK
jgi:hypothetical protein